MPRRGRLHITDGYYHVMGRGLERRRIFDHDVDKQDFLERLSEGLAETETDCLAWSLMSNHYHLLIRVGTIPQSQLMRKLLSGYATAYNRRHRRAGYVFQNRYKSILCDEDSYFMELVRYIHLNPVKAKLIKTVKALDDYAWTGHAALMGKQSRPWQNSEDVLRYFGKRQGTARQRYRAFIQLGLSNTTQVDLSGGGLIRSYGGWQEAIRGNKDHETRIGDERILGDSQFVRRVLDEDDISLDEVTRLKQAGWDLEELIAYICEQYEVDEELITTKGRENNLSVAKGLICHLGMRRFGLTSTALSRRLAMSQSAVSRAAKRGLAYCREEGVEFEFS